jgi:large subunit ribosomal protein L4
MAKLQTLNTENSVAGEIELSDSILETPYHAAAIKDTVIHFRAGQRQGTHATKERADVAGSTRKLWRQKGTGRARVGSKKAPQWRHGGTVFGPHPRDYSYNLNKKVRRLALRSALAEKFRQNSVIVLDDLNLTDHKTKNLKSVLDRLDCSKCLIVVENIDENLRKASGNLPDVLVMTPRNLNVYELLHFPKLLMVKSAISGLEERLK